MIRCFPGTLGRRAQGLCAPTFSQQSTDLGRLSNVQAATRVRLILPLSRDDLREGNLDKVISLYAYAPPFTRNLNNEVRGRQ